jgi:aspartate/methionine/tyrosine aminotransferase
VIPAVPFALERLFARHEFTAQRLLSSSDCDALGLGDVIDGFDDDERAAWQALRLSYTDSRGALALRAAIAADYDSVDVEDLVTVVPEEGVLLALTALLEPGTPVVATVPAYASLVEIARARGAVFAPWRPRIVGDRISFDVDDLAAALADAVATGGGRPPVVIVNFPHNPTGFLPLPSEWQRLFELVERAGGRVFSDEMYRHLELPPREPLPAAVDVSARAVSLSGLSKSLSAPGLRTGWLACRDRVVVERLATLRDWTTICGVGPAEILAQSIVRRRRSIEAQNRQTILRNLAHVVAGVSGHPQLTCFAPHAGSVALLRLGGVVDAAPLCERLVTDTGAMFVAGGFFAGADDVRGCVRLGLGRSSFAADFDAVLPALVDHLPTGG